MSWYIKLTNQLMLGLYCIFIMFKCKYTYTNAFPFKAGLFSECFIPVKKEILHNTELKETLKIKLNMTT